jgi:uncharacterized protein YmfQ (DUF2313 family)
MSKSAADFQTELMALLPPGDAWPRDPGSVLGRLLLAAGDGLAGIDAAADQLYDEADPRTTLLLLPDWERNFGLPDPCAGPAPSLQARRQQLVARVTDQGGQSQAIIIAKMAALGFDVTITTYQPAYGGIAVGGSPALGPGWEFVWAINLPANTVTYAAGGVSAGGDPVAEFGNDVLFCEAQRISPAHTILIFTILP